MYVRDRVDRAEALLYLGYKGQVIGIDLERRLDCAIQECERDLWPQGLFLFYDVAFSQPAGVVLPDAAEQGLYAGPRFSSGYGDLPLSAQRPYREALDATSIMGLSMTEDGLLAPTKSTTAVRGLFEWSSPHKQDSFSDIVSDSSQSISHVFACGAPRSATSESALCENCPQQQSCPLRKQGRTCHG